MHLFSNVKCELAGQEIRCVNNPRFAGVLMGIAKYPYDYACETGLIQCWSPESSHGVLMERGFGDGRSISLQNPIPTARSVLQSSWRICLVSTRITTKWFMVCDKSSLLYDKVMMLSSRLQLQLTKVVWVLPRVHPNDAKMLPSLLETIMGWFR